MLIEGPHRFDGVRVIGVGEHCWRHTRRGDKYVTVIIDLTPIRDGTGPASVCRITGLGSLAHFQLGPAEISKAISHATVQEIGYILGGAGQMWRRQEAGSRR